MKISNKHIRLRSIELKSRISQQITDSYSNKNNKVDKSSRPRSVIKPLEKPILEHVDLVDLKAYDHGREDSTVSALLDFYKHRNLRFNIALMGDRSAGKTSFLRSILEVRLSSCVKSIA